MDKSQENLDKAVRRRLIDEDMDLENAVKESDIIIISTPVNAMLHVLPQVLDLVEDQVVIDVGSTKVELLKSVKNHPKRTQYIGTHPMAGTEHSGPEAAIPNLFNQKTTVICNAEQSKKEAVELIKKMYNSMEMKLIYICLLYTSDAADE